MMGGGKDGTVPTKPKGGGGGGGNLWYVICRNGKVAIVKEGDVGIYKELHTPFETKQDAIDYVSQNHSNGKC